MRMVTSKELEGEARGAKQGLMFNIRSGGKRLKRVRKELKRLRGYKRRWIDSDI